MKTKTNPFRPFSAAAFVAVVFAMSSSAHAQSIWDGGDPANGSWAAAANWNPDGAPAFNNTTALVFDNTTRATTNTYFGGTTRLVKSITFGAAIDGTWTTATSTGSILTFSSDTGTAALNVDIDADAQIGFIGGVAGVTTGFQRLNSNLEINHSGSGVFTWNRQTDGVGGITKNGRGTFIIAAPNSNSFTGAIQVNEGRLVMGSTSGATGDFNTSSGITLDGGILEVRTTSALNKTVSQNLTVSSASTFVYNNTGATDQSLTILTGTMALNGNLTVQNISSSVAGNNIINISRTLTGNGSLIVDTYNDIASSGSSFSPGRVQLSGSSPGWAGNLVIAKGTAQLSGNTAATLGSGLTAGDIVIGTDMSAFGAGLTFNTNTSLTFVNDIIVNPGGFRAIRGDGSNNVAMTFSGAVNLGGNLTLDHSWGAADNRITLSGPVTGDGGLTITRAWGGNTETTSVLSGVSNYGGPTTIEATASLAITATGSVTSNIIVKSTGRLGGSGETSGNLTLEQGANFFFYTEDGITTPANYDGFSVTGAVTVDNPTTFGIASLVGGSRGELVRWATTPAGTYTLIGTTSSTFNTITNFGVANAATGLPGGRTAHFQNGGGSLGGGLQLVINSGYTAWQIANGNTVGGLDDDHDDDGVDNGTEFFLSGSTNSTGFTPLPGVVDTSGVLSVTWVKGATYTGAYTTDFVVETSDTLATESWVTATEGTGPDQVVVSGNDVKYTFPTGTKKFARLKVTDP